MMKTVLILLSLLPLLSYGGSGSIHSSRGNIYISKEPSNSQVFLERDGKKEQITKFKRREYIDRILLSQDDSLLLIYHKPFGSNAYRLSVLDLSSFTILQTIKPGYGGRLFWTKSDNILLVWGCGSECSVFRLYDRHLNTITEQGEGCLEEIVDQDVIVALPCISVVEGKFIVWSLSSGKVVHNFSCKQKYGNYVCQSFTYNNGKMTARLWIEGKNGQEDRSEEVSLDCQ